MKQPSDPPRLLLPRWLALVTCGFSLCASHALGAPGAAVPWTTYEAEAMVFSGGFIQGPNYTYNTSASEASGRRCVRLNTAGAFVQFTNRYLANSIVVRYSVPDTNTDFTISLYTNNVFAGKLSLTSRYSWLYGSYPFVNTPGSTPRNFYDEVRTNGIPIGPGDVVKLQKDASDTAPFYDIDLVDLENAAPPLAQPANSLSIANYGATGNGITDDTAALVSCISAAVAQSKTVWLPPGTYKITQAVTLPSNLTLQGAGMWHSTLVGDTGLYTNSGRRVALYGNGNNIHLADFAILGKLTYRNDSEPNDGIGGSFGTGSTISRIWVEHTKTGAWIVNSLGLVVDGCRFRNTIADGINLCVGMRSCTVINCTARGTGDDCFAIWPATYISASFLPGLNTIRNCTGQAAFLANGGAVYGGEGNKVEDCLFQDMTYGCGVLLSTTFPVSHAFSGTTTVQRSDLVRCGGFDHGFTWRAALQFCLEKNGISGVSINNLNITNSASDGVSIILGAGALANATMAYVNIPNYGLGVSGRHGLWARSDAVGSMTVSNSVISEFRNDSPNFVFNFATSTIPVTVQTSPAGRSFAVDGASYSSAQSFTWMWGSSHSISTSSPQAGETGVRYLWNSWNDDGPISHVIVARTATNYSAEFATQYFLAMNTSPGGAAAPASAWQASGSTIEISATASNGYTFDGWAGSGPGSYSGTNNVAVITMGGPITQTSTFNFEIPADFNRIGIPIIAEGGSIISYRGFPGEFYALERTPDLGQPVVWQSLSTNSADNAGYARFTNQLPKAAGLFRVRHVTDP